MTQTSIQRLNNANLANASAPGGPATSSSGGAAVTGASSPASCAVGVPGATALSGAPAASLPGANPGPGPLSQRLQAMSQNNQMTSSSSSTASSAASSSGANGGGCNAAAPSASIASSENSGPTSLIGQSPSNPSNPTSGLPCAASAGVNNNNNNNNNNNKKASVCMGCSKPIFDRYLLKALDSFWHEDCLKCSCCDCRLGEVGNTLFTKANLILCRRDYLRLFGSTGFCSACSKTIPAFEMVMRARNNVYHLECFACQQCSHRFCVGDRFYLVDNKILCEYDYEERLLFANMANNYAALSTMKRQAAAALTMDDIPYSHPA